MTRQGLWHVKPRHRVAITLVASLALSGCGSSVPSSDVTVENAVLQLSPVPGRPAVAYFRLTTESEPIRLVSVIAPGFERVELHQSVSAGNMASMAPLKPSQLGFTAGSLTFAPGGKHAMVYGVPNTVKPGMTVPLTFTFDSVPQVSAEAEVRAAGGE